MTDDQSVTTPDAPKTYPPGPPAEADRRRPDFREGVPIRLWDGQDWWFPTPEIGHFYYTRGADGRTRMAIAFALGDDYSRLVDAFVETEDGDSEASALADLAYNLLSVNYDLAFGDCRGLLCRARAGDPHAAENHAMWQSIADVALGRVPGKLTATG